MAWVVCEFQGLSQAAVKVLTVTVASPEGSTGEGLTSKLTHMDLVAVGLKVSVPPYWL